MISDRDCTLFGRMPGLPDELFEHDGCLTKRTLRAAALAWLRPMRGELLWDVGAGAGSIGIEWCRAAEHTKAIGIERVEVRSDRALGNAKRLTPEGSYSLVRGAAKDVLPDIPDPDAVFVGGGASMEVLEIVHSRLGEHGRLLVHGITLEAELLCAAAWERWGGQLQRIATETLEPLGRLNGWHPARTLIQWSWQR